MDILQKFNEYNSETPEPIKGEALKSLLEMLGIDVLLHEERQEYFFEWFKDDKHIMIWLNDYI
jgi:hypothetical protein